MGILSLPKTILMMIIWAIPALISLYFFQAFPVVIGLWISGPVFLSAMLYNKTFKKFEPEEVSTDDSEWTVAEDEDSSLTETAQVLEEKEYEESKEE